MIVIILCYRSNWDAASVKVSSNKHPFTKLYIKLAHYYSEKLRNHTKGNGCGKKERNIKSL